MTFCEDRGGSNTVKEYNMFQNFSTRQVFLFLFFCRKIFMIYGGKSTLTFRENRGGSNIVKGYDMFQYFSTGQVCFFFFGCRKIFIIYLRILPTGGNEGRIKLTG